MSETNQPNVEPTTNSETTTATVTNQSAAVDIEQLSSAIAKKLSDQSAVLKKLAETPDEISPEGLKHLAEQTAAFSEKITSLKSAILNEQTSIKEELSVFMEDYNKTKFENAKAKIVKQYDLPEEIAVVLDEVTIDKLEAVAKTLAEGLTKTGIPAKLGSKTTKQMDVPAHLQHLLG